MAFADHEMTHLIQVSPGKAREKIKRVLKSQGAHMANTAKVFGCTHGTLLRWIERLDMKQAVADLVDLAKAEGWHQTGNKGRPEGSTVANGAAPRNSLNVSDRSDTKRRKTA